MSDRIEKRKEKKNRATKEGPWEKDVKGRKERIEHYAFINELLRHKL